MDQKYLPASLNGVVTQFKGDGRKLGYPTANIISKTGLDDGVYFGFADLADYRHKPALIFVGTPTTIKQTTSRVEAHLLDIEDKDYYGERLILEILHFHRPNQKFKSVEDLIEAIKSDEKAGRKWLKSNTT